MKRLSRIALLLGLMLLAGAANAQVPVKRILIVGDSWAASIATEGYGQPGFGSFDQALAENGLKGYVTQGEQTAWGGRKASDWVKPENLERITAELSKYHAIDVVHLVIGGNDFLSKAASGVRIASYTPEQRAEMWDAIIADIEKIVNHCLAQRPDIRVLISDYDYLDPAPAEAAYKFDFGGATTKEVNEAFIELGRRKLELARKTPRCAYVSNWGLLQHCYGYPKPGLPPPGKAPGYEPYFGGDPASPMPPAAHVGDGVHPNNDAHREMLKNCIEQFYRTWLTTSGLQPDRAPVERAAAAGAAPAE